MESLSHTEENYLKALFHLSEEEGSVSTNALSADMQTTPASVNDMLKKLHKKGLASHVKYKGATITENGKKIALGVIRKHRLWEVFLVNKLNFKWDEVHEIAEQLEHIKSPLLTDRLDAFLEHPKFDPHGDPIPDSSGKMPTMLKKSLKELRAGHAGRLIGVGVDDPKLLQHLESKGLRLGVEIAVIAYNDFDESYEIDTSETGKQFISSKVADLLLISLNETSHD